MALSRKRRRRAPSGWSNGLDDLHDYLRAPPKRAASRKRIEVVSKTEVRIRGLRSELLRTLTAASGVEAAVLGVRAFEPKWRTQDDEDENWVIFV